MLKDLTPNWEEIKKNSLRWKELQDQGIITADYEYLPSYKRRVNTDNIPETSRLLLGFEKGDIPGMYVEVNFRFDEFVEYPDYRPSYEDEFKLFAPHYKKEQFGVADNVQQVLDYFFEECQDLDKNYFILMMPVKQNKENKGKGGGWRWHKWGEYIGKLPRKYEYLDDEDFDNVEEFPGYVICFHIYPFPS